MPASLDLSAAHDAATSTEESTPAIDTTASQPTETVSQTPPVTDTTASQAGAATPATAAAPAQPTAEQQWSLRQQLQQLGVQGQWADDRAAWQTVQEQWQRQAQEYQRAQEIAQYYLANKAKFDAALQPQQPAAQPSQQPATAEKDWWKAPEWNTDYERFLTTDDKGRVVAVPGADPTLPMKYEQYRSWQKDTLTKFLQNPIETIKPGLEQMIEAKAQELIEKKLGAYDAKQFASNYVAGAADWMYQKGQDGRPAVDSLGKPILTTAGQKFAGYVTEAESLGIQDARQQQNYAERMTQRDAYAAWYAQAQGKQPATPANGQPAPQAGGPTDA
jgi:hypothetical protein